MATSEITTILSGVSRGIGRAMAEQLARSGQRVIALSRNSVPELQEIAKANQTDWNELLVDLSDRNQTDEAGQALKAMLKDVKNARIILNAGIVMPIVPADHLTNLDEIAAAFDINIVAPIYLTGCFLQGTQQAADRRIMIISSGAGRNASKSWSVYCATKAAVDRFSEAVHIEEHPNVRISAVAPGIVDTPMQETIRGTDESLFPNREKFQNFYSQGQLASATETADKLLNLLNRDDYGSTVLDDVRQYT
ncbi:SDR family NAD(P)-dependent oxidoreductase [Orrella sp. 11846]|uniref:SDR family NAD(P)-dependent oxidoreductase n=1 Tax=Orrella sp. 11846 TaxID=3409913 RepID=UPI003B5C810B